MTKSWGLLSRPPAPQSTTTPPPASPAPKRLQTFADIAMQAPLSAAPGRPTLVTTEMPLGPKIQIDKGLYGTLPNTPPPAPKKGASYVASTDETEKKGGSPLIPIVFAISGLVFFVAYAVFWIKFFNIPVPFLPI